MSNTNQPTDMAVQAVLRTTELLEMILLRLPTANLARVKRVCHAWNDSIAGSTALQQHLFSEPIPTDTETWETSDEEYDKQLLIEPARFSRIGLDAHPLLTLPLATDEAFAAGFYGKQKFPSAAVNPKPLSILTSLAPGSWRDMLLTQPPCGVARLIALTGRRTLTDENGLRMGYVVDQVHDMKRELDSRKGITDDVDLWLEGRGVQQEGREVLWLQGGQQRSGIML